MSDGFATHLRPTCYAVIFTSRRTAGENSCGEACDSMVAIAPQKPGFLGLESTRGAEGLGITVPSRDSKRAIAHSRCNAEHAPTRAQGRSLRFEHDEVRVARVQRAYARAPAVLS